MTSYDELNLMVSYIPKRIKVRCSPIDLSERIYVPVKKCNVEITLFDDDAIGSSKCSLCNSNIDIFAKYCSNCGAKVIDRITKD